MRIISQKTIVDFYTQYPESKTALESWSKTVKKAKWNCFADVKKSFNAVDYVGNRRYVFNIKGNDFRMIAIIGYTPQKVFIRFIGTHAEYDKITDIKNI